VFDDLDEQPVTLLARTVSGYQFRVDGILSGLRVFADREGDRVRGTASDLFATPIWLTPLPPKPPKVKC
jgi:hypothetical protein